MDSIQSNKIFRYLEAPPLSSTGLERSTTQDCFPMESTDTNMFQADPLNVNMATEKIHSESNDDTVAQEWDLDCLSMNCKLKKCAEEVGLNSST